MLSKTLFKIIFVTSLIAGVALCIAAVWVPPLGIPGAALIAGAFGMYKTAFGKATEDPTEHVPDVRNMVPPEPVQPTIHIEQNIGLFFMYENGHREPLEIEYPERPRAPSPRLTFV